MIKKMFAVVNPWSRTEKYISVEEALRIVKEDIENSVYFEQWQYDFDGVDDDNLIQEWIERYREHGVEDILSIRYFC